MLIIVKISKRGLFIFLSYSIIGNVVENCKPTYVFLCWSCASVSKVGHVFLQSTNFEMFWFYNSFHEQFKDFSWEFVWKTWENVRFFRLPIPQMCCKRRITYCATMSIEKETYCFTRKIVIFESVMIRQESVKIILLVVKLDARDGHETDHDKK